jgi:hypothetical protein
MAKHQRPFNLLLWLGAGTMLIATAVALLVTPFETCLDCEGTGKQLEPSSDSVSDKCQSCNGRGRLGYFRKWTFHPELTYVGAADQLSWSPFIRPLSDREKLKLQPGAAMLKIMDIWSESPHEARRARELIERDAIKNGYRFGAPGKANPWGGK